MNRGNVVILVLSVLFSLIFTILPLPDWALAYRPEWVLMIVIFWNNYSHEHNSLLMVWLLGLAVDLLTDSVLGQHAFSLTLVGFLLTRTHSKFESYSLQKQTLIVGTFTFIYLLVNLIIYKLLGKPPNSWTYWGPVATSFFVWPWLFVVLREFKRNIRTQFR